MTFRIDVPGSKDPVSGYPEQAKRQNTAMVRGDGFEPQRTVFVDRRIVPLIPKTPDPLKDRVQIYSESVVAGEEPRLFAVYPSGRIAELGKYTGTTRSVIAGVNVEREGDGLIMWRNNLQFGTDIEHGFNYITVVFPIRFRAEPSISVTMYCKDNSVSVFSYSEIPGTLLSRGFRIWATAQSTSSTRRMSWIARGVVASP